MPKIDPRYAEATYAERERLLSLFDGLTAEQWRADSLCTGWRTREVLAHLTMPFRLSGLGFLTGMLRNGFKFDRLADRDARGTAAAHDDSGLLELYRANRHNPWQPPGGGVAAALGHELIHGLDITEPLGLPAPAPEAIGLAMAGTRTRNLAYFGVDLTGRRLEASDTDFGIGEGTEVLRLPAHELLLILSGRRRLPATNQGDA